MNLCWKGPLFLEWVTYTVWKGDGKALEERTTSTIALVY